MHSQFNDGIAVDINIDHYTRPYIDGCHYFCRFQYVSYDFYFSFFKGEDVEPHFLLPFLGGKKKEVQGRKKRDDHAISFTTCFLFHHDEPSRRGTHHSSVFCFFFQSIHPSFSCFFPPRAHLRFHNITRRRLSLAVCPCSSSRWHCTYHSTAVRTRAVREKPKTHFELIQSMRNI